MTRRGLEIVLALLCFGPGASMVRSAADDDLPRRIDLPGESNPTARRLEIADRLAAEKRWPEAVADYRKIMEEAGDDLVPLGPGKASRCVQARQLCHMRLAALPAGALRQYRSRAEEQARKWLEQGRAAGDAQLLQRVVDEAFCTVSASQALDRLGDLAFEGARFDEAEWWWRRIALPASEVQRTAAGKRRSSEPLVFPDPPPDLAARARAKQVLARLFCGERQEVLEELKAFRALHGNASGSLAGKQGRYADILQTLVEQPDALALPPTEEAWTTFAANPARNPVLPRALPSSLWRDGWQWCFDLERHTRVPRGLAVPVPEPRAGVAEPVAQGARSLAFHPVIVGDLALVTDARFVTAYNLRTGRADVWYDLLKSHPDGNLKLSLPARLDLRYTLSASGGQVFARMGVQSFGPEKEGASFLVGLDAEPGHKKSRLRFDDITPRTGDERSGVFEGSPLVRGQRLYVAVTRFSGGGAVTEVHCYDANHRQGSPRSSLSWRQVVCDTDWPRDGGRRSRHHLLTLAGPELIYCSESGAMVALDALTGRRSWAIRYPPRARTGDEDGPSPRDLVPCVYAHGRLYAAPADSDTVLCLDPRTGQILWEREHLEVVQFFGVTRGRLIFTTSTSPSSTLAASRGIRALDAATGAVSWLQPADGELPAFGQGFVAGGEVFWPTTAGMRVLDVKDGEQVSDFDPVQLRPFVAGNLAYGNGYLVVTDATKLYAYVPPARQLGQRAKEAVLARGQPQEGRARFRLALAEADAGMFSQALEDLGLVEQLAGADERWRGEQLRERARRQRQDVLLELAGRVGKEQGPEAAAALLERAAASEFPVAGRLRALSHQAKLWLTAGQPARAVAVWQTILSEEVLRQGRFQDADGIPHRAGPFAAAQIAELIRSHGREVYADVEQRARTLLASVPGAERVRVLDRLAREYPNAAVIMPVLLQLAALHEQAGHPGAAAHAYRLYLHRGADSSDRPLALAGLARAYEQQHCWEAARTTWERLAREQGDHTVPALDAGHTIRQFVARQLQKKEYHSTDRPARPDLALPLLRNWQVPLGAPPERLLLPRGATDVTAVARDRPATLLLARGNDLVCRAAGTGEPCWKRTLAGAPLWVGQHADTVLVAAADTIYRLRLADGVVLWGLRVPGPDYLLRAPQPLLFDGGLPDTLSAFRLTSGRLFFLQGQRRLFALDAETGAILWSQWAPGASVRPLSPSGRFHPLYHAGEERLVVQTSSGKLWVLESRTGRKHYEAATSRSPWTQPPLVLDPQRVCVVTDADHVILLDPVAARLVWTIETDHHSSLTGEPLQLVGAGNALLVLTARNYGTEMACLDPHTGQRRWEVLIGRDAVAAQGAAVDDNAVYWTSRRILHACALTSGKLLWETALTGARGPVRVVRTQQALLACPFGPRPSGEFAIEVFDPKDGQPIQRLNFIVEASTPSSAGTEDERRGMVVQLFDHGAAVAVRDRAWGLTDSR